MLIKALAILTFSVAVMYTAGLQAQEKKVYTSLESALAQVDSVYILDLSGKRLKTFPMEVFDFPNLEVLKMRKCKLDDLPDMWPLPRLRVLDLEKNRIGELPRGLFAMTMMEDLRLGENEISSLPSAVGRLQRLERLELWGNYIGILPEEVEALKELKVLDMRLMEVSTLEQRRLELALPGVRKFFSTPCNCMDEDLLESESTEDR